MKGRPKKLFRLAPGDRGDHQRAAIRPDDSCFAVEQDYASSGYRDLEAYRLHRGQVGDVRFHTEAQNVRSSAWLQMLDLVDAAAQDQRSVFWPASELDPEDWAQIVELPRSIAKLKSVKHLRLYGSHLIRIPPEIGEMTSLEELDAYTSYRLHWFPYEITRCSKLRESRVSTRALYGSCSLRPPFPSLTENDIDPLRTNGNCSVCDGALVPGHIHPVWISLAVATDVLPLLARACSSKCVERLPQPPRGYVSYPHGGGSSLQQPPASFSPPR